MERMSLEEKKKWVEDHLGEYYAHTWRDIFETQVELAKAGFVDDIVVSKIDIDCTLLEVEIGVNRFYYGEPYSKQILCKQEWLGCDLSDLHAEIKDKDYETAIYIVY